MKFRFVRLLVGFPVFLLGFLISYFIPLVGWLVGVPLGLIGIYILSRALTYHLNGILFAVLGFPMFLVSMTMPNGHFFLSLCVSLVSGILAMASLNETA